MQIDSHFIARLKANSSTQRELAAILKNNFSVVISTEKVMGEMKEYTGNENYNVIINACNLLTF